MSLKGKEGKDLAGVSQALRITPPPQKKECIVNGRAFPVDEQD